MIIAVSVSGSWNRMSEMSEVSSDSDQRKRIQRVFSSLQWGVWHSVWATLQGENWGL